MKKIFSKIVTGIVTLSLLASLACHANETPEVSSFSDVPPTYWGYETIMGMTEYGIFKGTSTPVNGVGIFSPEKTMTRAEFITATLRAVYPDAASKIEMDKEQWWRGYYVLALDKGFLKDYELNNGDMNHPMSREEMAMVMVRCVENMGEELEKRVVTSQIADYETIGSYYKEYVRDCFSYGLLCGVDYKGTFAPTKTLTRAEAATVLCRLIDEGMRIEVEFLEETVDDDNRWDSYDETEVNVSASMPWNNGGKKPSEYSWEEFQNLNVYEQEAFFEWFDSAEDFEDWRDNAYVEYPWDNGGKKPSEYSWEEFQSLREKEQEAFFEWFDSVEDFEDWVNQVQGNPTNTTGKYPWENGGKKPSEYTWEEFQALDEYEQEAFFDWFEAPEDFEDWQSQVQGNPTDTTGKYPWESRGKKPSEYTWEEFQNLNEYEQEAFFAWFETPEDFEDWMNNVT